MDTRTTVVLAHALVMYREGLKWILEEAGGIRVVGEAGSGEKAVRLAREKKPDIVLVDAAIRETSVIRVIRAMAPLGPKTKVVVLTNPRDEASLERIVGAGAMGSIGTHRTAERLAMVVELVAAGRTCFPLRASWVAQGRTETNGSGIEARLAKLTDKERDLLALTVQGFTSKEIARRLFMTPNSVDNARYRVRRKLRLKTRADLMALAVRAGLLEAVNAES